MGGWGCYDGSVDIASPVCYPSALLALALHWLLLQVPSRSEMGSGPHTCISTSKKGKWVNVLMSDSF